MMKNLDVTTEEKRKELKLVIEKIRKKDKLIRVWVFSFSLLCFSIITWFCLKFLSLGLGDWIFLSIPGVFYVILFICLSITPEITSLVIDMKEEHLKRKWGVSSKTYFITREEYVQEVLEKEAIDEIINIFEDERYSIEQINQIYYALYQLDYKFSQIKHWVAPHISPEDMHVEIDKLWKEKFRIKSWR